jgi:hypothetical protein
MLALVSDRFQAHNTSLIRRLYHQFDISVVRYAVNSGPYEIHTVIQFATGMQSGIVEQQEEIAQISQQK